LLDRKPIGTGPHVSPRHLLPFVFSAHESAKSNIVFLRESTRSLFLFRGVTWASVVIASRSPWAGRVAWGEFCSAFVAVFCLALRFPAEVLSLRLRAFGDGGSTRRWSASEFLGLGIGRRKLDRLDWWLRLAVARPIARVPLIEVTIAT